MLFITNKILSAVTHYSFPCFIFQFKFRLTVTMIIDFAGCWVIEKICKFLFADLEPKAMITRGRERREKRRAQEVLAKQAAESEKKAQ